MTQSIEHYTKIYLSYRVNLSTIINSRVLGIDTIDNYQTLEVPADSREHALELKDKLISTYGKDSFGCFKIIIHEGSITTRRN